MVGQRSRSRIQKESKSKLPPKNTTLITNNSKLFICIIRQLVLMFAAVDYKVALLVCSAKSNNRVHSHVKVYRGHT